VANKNSEDLQLKKKSLGNIFAGDYVTSQFSFYLAIAAIIFLNPLLVSGNNEQITKIVAATLFLIGPVSSVIGSIPDYARANAAARNILSLEEKLRSCVSESQQVSCVDDFSQLKLRAIRYDHKNPDGSIGFSVGPIDLHIDAGKVIFITGGNGSGKTTLLKLITGLYEPHAGLMMLDSLSIGYNNIVSYRNMFSSVFSDFYLFKNLYGVADYSDEEAEKLLELFEMNHKVKLRNRYFNTTDLSQGQRKRLGLISAILEKRKIYILDEFAADQDPQFRHKFYTQILPLLKESGATIIAITHDDRYFHMADVRIEMMDGKLNSVKVGDSK
jgi:putative ATP-binding cassette transporter